MPVVGRPGLRLVVAAGAFLHQAGVALASLRYIDIEPTGVRAVGAEGEGFAVVAPAAELMDGLRLPRQVGVVPAVAEAVVGVAGEAAQVVQLCLLIAAAVHAEDQLRAAGVVPGAADAV